VVAVFEAQHLAHVLHAIVRRREHRPDLRPVNAEPVADPVVAPQLALLEARSAAQSDPGSRRHTGGQWLGADAGIIGRDHLHGVALQQQAVYEARPRPRNRHGE
jgi:hypothetical protein